MKALSDRQRYALHVALRYVTRDGCGTEHRWCGNCAGWLAHFVTVNMNFYDRHVRDTGARKP